MKNIAQNEIPAAIARTVSSLTIEAHPSMIVSPHSGYLLLQSLVAYENQAGRSVFIDMKNVGSVSPFSKVIPARCTPLALGLSLLPAGVVMADVLNGTVMEHPAYIGNLADALVGVAIMGLTGLFSKRDFPLCALYKLGAGNDTTDCVWAERLDEKNLHIRSSKVSPSFSVSKQYLIFCR